VLDVSFAPEVDFEVLYLRPGTHITYNPRLLWTSGLDGFLDSNKAIPPFTGIEVLRAKDKELVTSVRVESDGFFVVEGIVPGDYLLKVTDVNNPPKPLKFTLKNGESWKSGVYINWKQ
jgi:hypothetical protein